MGLVGSSARKAALKDPLSGVLHEKEKFKAAGDLGEAMAESQRRGVQEGFKKVIKEGLLETKSYKIKFWKTSNSYYKGFSLGRMVSRYRFDCDFYSWGYNHADLCRILAESAREIKNAMKQDVVMKYDVLFKGFEGELNITLDHVEYFLWFFEKKRSKIFTLKLNFVLNLDKEKREFSAAPVKAKIISHLPKDHVALTFVNQNLASKAARMETVTGKISFTNVIDPSWNAI